MDNATPTVTKGQCDTYVVRNGYDAATICIQEWAPRETANGTLYGGVILAHSSFGSYCNAWAACAVPFKRFLIGCDFDYFMTKCLGLNARQYDGESTERGIKEIIIERRRYDTLSRDDARAAWDALESYHWPDGEYVMREAADDEALAPVLGSDWWELIRNSPTAQSRGFWCDIWPHFVAAIKAEIADSRGK